MSVHNHEGETVSVPKNQPGSRSKTTAPVIVPKPDLRGWPVRKTPVDLADIAPVDRLRWKLARKSTRPLITRWRVANGVCERYGDEVKIFIGACQRPKCPYWFRVERTPGNVNGRWPSFCSETCQDLADGARDRKNAKKVRRGETSGRKRPKVRTFDPGAEDAFWLAQEIVEFRVTSTPKAFEAAAAYVADWESEGVSEEWTPVATRADFFQSTRGR